MIKEKLEIIVGNHIMQGGKSGDDIVRLAKGIDYLHAQMYINKRWCDDTGKKHIEEVLKNLHNILL